jgi:hypothetical protein
MMKYLLHIYDEYIPLMRDGATQEQVLNAALEHIHNSKYNREHKLYFEIIEVANVEKHNTLKYQDLFEKWTAEKIKHAKELHERIEKEQFERLKKKFEK